jgi:hypothetical protein
MKISESEKALFDILLNYEIDRESAGQIIAEFQGAKFELSEATLTEIDRENEEAKRKPVIVNNSIID